MRRAVPSLRALRVFEAVARHLSFRKAADELFVTHSAVSHQIKLLEEEIGVPLFRRHGRSIELTDDGRMLFRTVGESLDAIGASVGQIRQRNQARTLTVQTYVTFGTLWLIPRLNDFQRRNPDIRVRISISFSDVDFDRDDADVGVIMGERVWSHLRYDYLCNMEMFPVCAPELVADGRLASPEALSGEVLIGCDLWPRDWPLWLKLAGVRQDIGASGPQVDNYLQALEEVYKGGGLAIARRPFCARDLADGRLVQPFELVVDEPGSWYLVYPKERTVREEIRLFRAWLLEQVRADEHMLIRPQG